MAGQQGQENMMDGMKKILAQIATLMLAPDADPKFLQMLQQGIVQFLQQKAKATLGPGMQQPGGMPGMGGPPGAGGPPGGRPPMGIPGMPPGGAPPNMMGPGGGGGPTGLAPSAPNLDELNRVLGSTGQVK